MSVDLARVSLTVTDLLARRGPTTTDDLLLALREVPQLRGLDHRALLDDLGTDFAPGPWRPWVPAERDVPIEPGMVRSRRDGTRIREISEAALWFGQQQLPDGRWVASWSVMIDRVLTHRLTASEIDTGVALLDPDLAPMLLAAFWAQYYTNGASIDLCVLADLGLGDRVDVDDIGVLPGHTWVVLLGDVLPDGIGPGDLIGFQATRSGVVVRTVARAERFPDGAVRALTALVNDHPQGLRAAEAACALCVEVPELFSQGQRPFIELVVEAGVLHHDWWLLPAGTDIEEWEA
ncbi:MAG: hypothetical protein FWD11_01685, partial [Micrococcales bacterium]|nr:hypothetical protein [Micrococcales bacterium]